jgi:hypothetical protein
MNWFDRKQLIDLLKLSQSNSPMIKTAAEPSADDGSTTYDWKNQMGNYVWFGDVNRYVMDSYTIKVYLSKTNENITISLMTNHSYLGTAQYCVFWAFDFNEEKHAIEIYKKLNKAVEEIVKYFVDNQRPTSLFDPYLREKVQKVDDRHLIRTNIPSINYSYDIDYAKDWDKNIYGPRYPSYKEVSFNQYLNSSVYSDSNNAPSGKFAL